MFKLKLREFKNLNPRDLAFDPLIPIFYKYWNLKDLDLCGSVLLTLKNGKSILFDFHLKEDKERRIKSITIYLVKEEKTVLDCYISFDVIGELEKNKTYKNRHASEYLELTNEFTNL